ncbi:MAG TPA: GNAT family N-acetyltransferase [Longimicrobium sp.]|uniref:GNAT family N-acetyltransferase n=1 Tax=Longimicrobium sp. TaxID=2029185 RepID=UPI002ED92124
MTERHTTKIALAAAETDEQIQATWAVMRQLRPHLPAGGAYLARVREMMASEGFRLAAALEDGEVRAVAGYRMLDTLFYGRVLWVDDLVADEAARSRGLGSRLLAWLCDRARREGCTELQLISGVHRERAHRFYFREGLGMNCFHFRKRLV